MKTKLLPSQRRARNIARQKSDMWLRAVAEKGAARTPAPSLAGSAPPIPDHRPTLAQMPTDRSVSTASPFDVARADPKLRAQFTRRASDAEAIVPVEESRLDWRPVGAAIDPPIECRPWSPYSTGMKPLAADPKFDEKGERIEEASKLRFDVPPEIRGLPRALRLAREVLGNAPVDIDACKKNADARAQAERDRALLALKLIATPEPKGGFKLVNDQQRKLAHAAGLKFDRKLRVWK